MPSGQSRQDKARFQHFNDKRLPPSTSVLTKIHGDYARTVRASQRSVVNVAALRPERTKYYTQNLADRMLRCRELRTKSSYFDVSDQVTPCGRRISTRDFNSESGLRVVFGRYFA